MIMGVLQEGQETWHSYLDYIDGLVIDGLLHTVACSIGFLLDETDPSLTQVITAVKRSYKHLVIECI